VSRMCIVSSSNLFASVVMIKRYRVSSLNDSDEDAGMS